MRGQTRNSAWFGKSLLGRGRKPRSAEQAEGSCGGGRGKNGTEMAEDRTRLLPAPDRGYRAGSFPFSRSHCSANIVLFFCAGLCDRSANRQKIDCGIALSKPE